MLAPDCSLSGVQTARYYVCNLFGYLHCVAHSTKHISTHCLCCVCLVLHEWHHCRQQSDSRNRSELVQLASSQQSSQAALVAVSACGHSIVLLVRRGVGSAGIVENAFKTLEVG